MKPQDIGALNELLKYEGNRDCVLSLLEKDYQSYQLDPREPQLTLTRKVQVPLPRFVFSNVCEVFSIFFRAAHG